jgi:hypothetical protein
MRHLGIIAFCTLSLALTTAFVWRDGGMQKMSVTMNVRDLPKEGLALITVSDQSFTEILSKSDQLFPELEAAKPFSVILRNTGKQPVISFMLKWDFVTTDGDVFSRHYEYVTAFALEGGATTQRGGYILKPGSEWFFAPGFSVDLENLAAENQRPPAFVLNRIATDMAQISSITVSLDGVFFDDGTFVGPNNTSFFEKIEAFQRARQDVLNRLWKNAETKKDYEDVFDELTVLAKQPRKRLGKKSMISDYYERFKADFAGDIMSMKTVSGSKKTLDHHLKSLKREWPRLKKKD